MKESSNIQSGWREGKVNLRETENTKSCYTVFFVYKYTAVCIVQISCAASEVQRNACCLPEQVKHGGEKQLVVDGNAHVARFMEG